MASFHKNCSLSNFARYRRDNNHKQSTTETDSNVANIWNIPSPSSVSTLDSYIATSRTPRRLQLQLDSDDMVASQSEQVDHSRNLNSNQYARQAIFPSERLMDQLSVKVREDFEKLMSECQKNIDDFDKFRSTIAQLERHNIELQELTRSQTVRLAALEAAHRRQLDQLQTDSSTYHIAFEQQQLELKNLQAALEKLQEQNVELQQCNRDLSVAHESGLKELKAFHEISEETHQLETASLRAQNDELRSQRDAAIVSSQQDAHNARSQICRLQSHINLLTTEQQTAMQTQIERLQQQSATERHRLQDEAANMASKLEKLECSHAQVCAERDRFCAELNTLRHVREARRNEQQLLTAELDDRTDSMCSLTAENSRLQNNYEELRSRHESMQSTYSHLHARLIRDWDELHQQAEQRLHRMLQHDSRVDELTVTNAEMRSRTQRLNKEVLSQRKCISRLRELLAFVHGSEMTRKSCLKQSQVDMGVVQERMGQLNVLLQGVCRNIAETQPANEAATREHSKLIKELELLRSDYSKLQNDYKNLKDVKEHAVRALNLAKRWQLEQNERDAQTNAALSAHQTRIARLEIEREQLKKTLREKHRDNVIMHSQLHEHGLQQRSSPERPLSGDHPPQNELKNHHRSVRARYQSDPGLDALNTSIEQMRDTRILFDMSMNGVPDRRSS